MQDEHQLPEAPDTFTATTTAVPPGGMMLLFTTHRNATWKVITGQATLCGNYTTRNVAPVPCGVLVLLHSTCGCHLRLERVEHTLTLDIPAPPRWLYSKPKREPVLVCGQASTDMAMAIVGDGAQPATLIDLDWEGTAASPRYAVGFPGSYCFAPGPVELRHALILVKRALAQQRSVVVSLPLKNNKRSTDKVLGLARRVRFERVVVINSDMAFSALQQDGFTVDKTRHPDFTKPSPCLPLSKPLSPKKIEAVIGGYQLPPVSCLPLGYTRRIKPGQCVLSPGLALLKPRGFYGAFGRADVDIDRLVQGRVTPPARAVVQYNHLGRLMVLTGQIPEGKLVLVEQGPKLVALELNIPASLNI